MLKSKISGAVPDVILPDFPDDDNTVTTTITKSRRVSFGTNFVKEFIVGSAVSAQCIGEYEQAFSSSDSSNTDSSHSTAESDILDPSALEPESHKVHKPLVQTVGQTAESDCIENRVKPPKFSSTICFSADSPTADMEFTEGCITLAKSILDKKNKEMTVIIQAKPKESKDEEKTKEDETKYFDASQFEMSMTKCLKSKENKREEKRYAGEKTKIYGKFEDEMSITKCNNVFNNDESDISWEDCKENRMPLEMIMRHLDNDNSDLENDLFNPEKSFSNLLNPNPFDFSNDSEKLNLNESMDISADFEPNILKNLQENTLDEKHNDRKLHERLNISKKLISNESMEISGDIQNEGGNDLEIPPVFDSNISKNDEFEKICADSMQVKVNQIQPEHENSQNIGVKTMPFDFTKSIDAPSPSDRKIFDMQVMNIEEALKETNELNAESDEDKISHEKSEHQNSLEKLPQNENFQSVNNVKLAKESELMENINIFEPMSSAEKISNNQTESSDIVSPSESKMPNSLLCEEIMAEKSTDLSVSSKLNSDSIAELSTEVQPQPNDSQSLKGGEPMEICTDEVKVPEETENADFIVNNDDVSKENVEEILAMTLEVQQKAPERCENSTEVDFEKLNVSQSVDVGVDVCPKSRQNEPPELNTLEESDEIREPSLVDVKVIESLKEQSKEPGCVWSLNDLRYPQTKTSGLLSFGCKLLDSTTTVQFVLKMSRENYLNSCSTVTNSEISLNEEKLCRLPEYELVIGFGFQEMKKFFDHNRQKVDTIRHIPYFLDQINLFMFKMNSYLRQIHSILTLYPGSRLKGSLLSFRLYSFPIFFSSVVYVDLRNLFRLSNSSLSFENDFGNLDENKIRNIFLECLKQDNSLCEFVIRSTKYLIELEKEKGFVSKRSHIRLLPVALKL